jgi:uracil-DNA glycosylase
LNCSQYLVSELWLLGNFKVVLALGKIGFDAYCRAARAKGLMFRHGVRFDLGGRVLLASYHPSRQNTKTGRLAWQMWMRIFRKANAMIENNRA